MQVSRSHLMQMQNKPVRDILEGLMRQAARKTLTNVTVIDNSTGTAGSSTVAVNTPSKFTYVSGTTLAPRAGFNTAVSAANDAVAVLAGVLTNDVLTKLGLTTVTGGNGNVAVARTVPAIGHALAGSDGSGSTALLRSEASAIITTARNNLATVIRAYNVAAIAIGVATLADNTGGKTTSLALSNYVPAATATGNSGDVVSVADANAVLNALANDVAFVASKINTSLLASATLNAIIAPVLVP